MATDQMWLNVINDVEADPVLRGRYRSGNLGIRRVTRSLTQLSSYAKRWRKWTSFYPNHRGYVLVSHSLGGVLSQMQIVTLTRRLGANCGRASTEDFFKKHSSR